MDMAVCDADAVAEAVVFLSYFKDLPDGRQRAKVKYPLSEVLLLCLLAVIAGAETITDIARFGEKKIALLRRFRPFLAGTRRIPRKRYRTVINSPDSPGGGQGW